jgi:hypothetical protein
VGSNPTKFIFIDLVNYYFILNSILGGIGQNVLTHLINERVNIMLLWDKLIIRMIAPTLVVCIVRSLNYGTIKELQ